MRERADVGVPRTDHEDWWLTLVGEHTREPDVDVGRMFNSQGLRLPGGFFTFAGHDDALMVKLPASRVRELIDEGRVEPVVMGRRTMREWAIVRAEPGGLQNWRALADEAKAFVATLPPKAPRR